MSKKPPILPRLDEWKTKLDDGRKKRREELIEALTVERGFIKRAAERLKISRQRATVLVQEMDLGAFVQSLRTKRGGFRK